MEIRPLEAELLHAERRTDRRTDRQTDMTYLMLAFRSFANAPISTSAVRFNCRGMDC